MRFTDEQLEYLARRNEAMAHDDEVQGWIRLHTASLSPVLRGKGWVRHSDGPSDGLGAWDHPHRGHRIIHSIARELDDQVWIHLSMSRRDRVLPTWEQIRDIWWWLYPTLPAVQLVMPPTEHVNLNEVAHLWGCLDRWPLPDFTHGMGTI